MAVCTMVEQGTYKVRGYQTVGTALMKNPVVPVPITDGTSNCAGPILLDKQDFDMNNMVTQLVTPPASVDFLGLWAAGFILPMTIALLAWAVRRIISMWS